MPESSDDTPRVLVTPEDLLGFEIDGRYRLDSIIGGGGMGVVYRTTQHNLNREIAIKLLKLEDVGNEHRVERFQREIDIIAQMSHPNIVRVFDSGREPELGLHYIAMELIEGVALDEVLKSHRLKPELAIDIAYEVAAALTEPHRSGIIHRDIKPQNVLLSVRSDDTLGVKVVDFGIARATTVDEDAGKITTTGVVIGSPMYMAPEAARGERLDPRTDLYSLGVLIYEMVSGKAPFGGTTPVAIMLKQAVEDPPSLADAVGPDFRIPELVELVEELLSKDARDRPADANAVLRRLDALRAAHGLGRVRVDGSLDPTGALSTMRVPLETEEKTPPLDPHAATTPYQGDSPPRSGSDSFNGWLVPESARDALGSTTVVSPPTHRAREPVDPEGDTRSGPTFTLAVLAVVAVLAVAVTGYVLMSGEEEPAAEEKPADVVQLGTEEPTAPPQAIEEPVVAAGPDVGMELDAGERDAVAEPEPLVAPADGESQKQDATKPKTKPDRTDRGTEPEGDELNENLEWLNKK